METENTTRKNPSRETCQKIIKRILVTEVLEKGCNEHFRQASDFMGYLKGKSALMMFEKHANLKYKFGNRHFGAEGYYVSTVGLNEATIRKYIEDQEKHDIALDKSPKY